MVAYSAEQLARCRARAIREGLKLRTTPDPLRYRATSSKAPAGPYVYDQAVSTDLASATCTCAATACCDHGGAAVCAARLARAHQAARDLRRHQLWQRQLAAIAA